MVLLATAISAQPSAQPGQPDSAQSHVAGQHSGSSKTSIQGKSVKVQCLRLLLPPLPGPPMLLLPAQMVPMLLLPMMRQLLPTEKVQSVLLQEQLTVALLSLKEVTQHSLDRHVAQLLMGQCPSVMKTWQPVFMQSTRCCINQSR